VAGERCEEAPAVGHPLQARERVLVVAQLQGGWHAFGLRLLSRVHLDAIAVLKHEARVARTTRLRTVSWASSSCRGRAIVALALVWLARIPILVEARVAHNADLVTVHTAIFFRWCFAVLTLALVWLADLALQVVALVASDARLGAIHHATAANLRGAVGARALDEHALFCVRVQVRTILAACAHLRVVNDALQTDHRPALLACAHILDAHLPVQVIAQVAACTNLLAIRGATFVNRRGPIVALADIWLARAVRSQVVTLVTSRALMSSILRAGVSRCR